MRITKSDLEGRVDYLNELTGMPSEPYGPRTKDNNCNPQAGNYHLSWAYGGVQLERMSMTKGCSGVDVPLSTGYCSKRECYNAINSFITGVKT